MSDAMVASVTYFEDGLARSANGLSAMDGGADVVNNCCLIGIATCCRHALFELSAILLSCLIGFAMVSPYIFRRVLRQTSVQPSSEDEKRAARPMSYRSKDTGCDNLGHAKCDEG